MARTTYDVYIVGLGGQGILTIGDLLAQTALTKGLPVNFYPTKGMSQRGGFVQGQLRIGYENAGPSLPPKGADLIISMETGESLKAVRYIHDGTDFLIYQDVWPTTGMLMGKTGYPEMDAIADQIKGAGATLYALGKDTLPEIDGVPVRANMYILGAVLKNTSLHDLFTYDEIAETLKTSFKKGVEANLLALKAGYEATIAKL